MKRRQGGLQKQSGLQKPPCLCACVCAFRLCGAHTLHIHVHRCQALPTTTCSITRIGSYYLTFGDTGPRVKGTRYLHHIPTGPRRDSILSNVEPWLNGLMASISTLSINDLTVLPRDIRYTIKPKKIVSRTQKAQDATSRLVLIFPWQCMVPSSPTSQCAWG